MKPYLNHGVFQELKNIDYFNQVDISFGAVTWPHEQQFPLSSEILELSTL